MISLYKNPNFSRSSKHFRFNFHFFPTKIFHPAWNMDAITASETTRMKKTIFVLVLASLVFLYKLASPLLFLLSLACRGHTFGVFPSTITPSTSATSSSSASPSFKEIILFLLLRCRKTLNVDAFFISFAVWKKKLGFLVLVCKS